MLGTWAEELTQQVKCLSHKSDNQSLDSQNPCEAGCSSAHIYKANMYLQLNERQGAEIPGSTVSNKVEGED